ncbi:hypothetical protein PENTCL1PPCAC_17708, partial [Pristionchus entomophagus]
FFQTRVQIWPNYSVMNGLSEKDKRDGMIKELIRLKIANRLMDEEMKRLEPELAKYESSSVHPAARPIQPESVSTMSLTDKTKGIKQDTSKLKVVENDLTALNSQVTALFKDVQTKVIHRDSLFSEIELATSKMSSLTVECTEFEDDSGKIKNSTRSNSEQMASLTNVFQERMKEKFSKLASLKRTKADLDKTFTITQQRIQEFRALNAEYTSKIDVESLAQQKAKLEDMKEKTAQLNEYLVTVTKDEGEALEALTTSITECEQLKQTRDELSRQLEEISAREEQTVTDVEEVKKRVDTAQASIDQLAIKKELLLKNHEILMGERKQLSDSLIDSLKIKKGTAEKKLKDVKKRIEIRDECVLLRKELDAMGKIEALDLSTEIASLKQEIDNTRTNTAKALQDSENYQIAADKCNSEAYAMHIVVRRRRDREAKVFQEKDNIANHLEDEVFNLKKKLRQEKAEKENRLAQETRRLLEKAKEEKERREKGERRKREKEKEEKKKMEKEKMRKMRDEEEKKKKKVREEEEKQAKKKKEEEKTRAMEAILKKNTASAFASRVQQRRKNMEESASIPFADNDGSLMRPPKAHASLPPPPRNVRPRSNQRKPMLIYDDDSSEDDDDDMSDFLMDDSSRVMPKVPEKYDGSPPRMSKRASSLNPFDLSFADVQSSTPLRSQNDPAPAFELSFSQVITSTPLLDKRSKANKKKTRSRGKKKSK